MRIRKQMRWPSVHLPLSVCIKDNERREINMTITSLIELKDMVLATDIGTYGPDDPVPDHHLFDMTLEIAPMQVQILQDSMEHVFDCDPFIADIIVLAKTGYRETQEWLTTQIVQLCAQYSDIRGVDVYLRKLPADHVTGTLRVWLCLGENDLAVLRAYV